MTACLLPSIDAKADAFCRKDWQPTEKLLQEARRQLKSQRHRDAAGRVECGIPIVKYLDGTHISADCLACEREYVELLKDIIQFARHAAEQSASVENRRHYYLYEIEVRQVLGEFLTEANDITLLKTNWDRNFEGLGDAMERIDSGLEFHNYALVASLENGISKKSYKTWARAIRSCKTWNFESGRNRDMAGLKKILLCVDECKVALAKIRQRVNTDPEANRILINEILDSLLPALEECPILPPDA